MLRIINNPCLRYEVNFQRELLRTVRSILVDSQRYIRVKSNQIVIVLRALHRIVNNPLLRYDVSL